LEQRAPMDDPLTFTIIDRAAGAARGLASFMRIVPEHGVIEIGHIWLSPQLQRTRQATEAIYLMSRYAFDDLGNRRLEWKCNAENTASRRAAERFGFTFEGVFRQHMVIKGRNRDSAWYAITDAEWPARRAAFEAWLAPANFDPSGVQRRSLAEVRGEEKWRSTERPLAEWLRRKRRSRRRSSAGTRSTSRPRGAGAGSRAGSRSSFT